MIRHLSITLDNQHGALLRLFGTIERRGWLVKAIDMTAHNNDGKCIKMMIERNPHHAGTCSILLRHIAKLFCVRHAEEIEITSSESIMFKTQIHKDEHKPSTTAGVRT